MARFWSADILRRLAGVVRVRPRESVSAVLTRTVHLILVSIHLGRCTWTLWRCRPTARFWSAEISRRSAGVAPVQPRAFVSAVLARTVHLILPSIPEKAPGSTVWWCRLMARF